MYQLKYRQIFLPPEKFVKSWTDSREQIIPVHDNVYERIQKRANNGWK